MPENDQVDVPVDSPSDEALPQPDTTKPATADKPEATPASPDKGTAAETPGPEVDWQAKLDEQQAKSNQAYNELKGKQRQDEAELQSFRDARDQAVAAIYADKDAYQDTLFDPVKGPQLIRQMFDGALQERQGADAQAKASADGVAAGERLKEFAMKEAGMTAEQFEVFLHKNRDHTGVPFGAYTPEQAEKMAKALIRDECRDVIDKQRQTLADKNADEKAKKKMASQAPSAGPVGTPAEKTPGEQFVDDLVAGSKEDDINTYLP